MYSIEEFDKQKSRVLKYIVYKRRTESEIKLKFRDSIDIDMLEDIIEYLKEAGYINDIEYIKRTVNNFKNLKNLSQMELKYKLIAKGLNKNNIENFFYNNKEELEQYEISSAKNIFIKKSKEHSIDEIKQFLMKKGYKKDNITKAIEE